MKRVIILLALFSSTSAFAKFVGRTGCSPSAVTVAQEAVDKIKAQYNSGSASNLDVALAQIQLADMRYCAGDTTLPTSAFCDDQKVDSKAALLNLVLALRTAEANSGLLPTSVVRDTQFEVAQCQRFCSDHKSDQN